MMIDLIPSQSDWQTGFLRMLSRIETHAQISFRQEPPERRLEHIQETIALACVAYQRLAMTGNLAKAFPGPLAEYSVRQVRGGRHAGGSQDAARDVLSGRAQMRHGFSTSADGICGGLAIVDRRVDVADHAAFCVDFEVWVLRQRPKMQKVIAMLASGESTGEVAEALRLSAARVSQFRRRLEDDWRAYQGDAA